MFKPFVSLLLALCLTACAVNNVTTDYDPNVLLAGTGRYAWAPAPGGASNFTSLDQQRIRAAVDHALMIKPMQPVAPANAEVWVQGGIDLREVRDVSTMEMGAGFGSPVFIGGDTIVHVQQYTEAVIYVQFIDPKTRRVVWRGQVTRQWSESMPPAKREQILRDAVTQIVARFPPLPGQ